VPADWPLAIARGETRRGVFIDTETTGLDLDTDEVIELALMPFEYERDRLGLHALLECARRQLWVIRAEDTAFEQRASLKARGYRWDDGEGKRVKAWWLFEIGRRSLFCLRVTHPDPPNRPRPLGG
jgi:hypothetical protein